MRKTELKLSDGRDIFYFDLDSRPIRSTADSRNLESSDSHQAVMRFDLLTGEWVSIAGHRQARIYHPRPSECPLCPSTSDNQSEIPESTYDVVVFENRFPSFAGELGSKPVISPSEWGATLPAAGRCEVIAYSDQHNGNMGQLNAEQMKLVIAAWIDRNNALSSQLEVEYVFIFENRGAEVGVTLHHPHGQIYGYPFIPSYVSKIIAQSKRYRSTHSRSMLDDIVAKELLADERIIYQDASWIAFVPHAARWPYEIQIHPIRRISNISELNEREIASLSLFLPSLVKALDSLFDKPLPYMAGWIQGPVKSTGDTEDLRLFYRLVSVQRGENKLKFLAGSESLMGAWISDILPEDAAARVRAALNLVQS
jgi:UDPglucose--hexose-1-phosphate uridylyltransferase